jgi:hypothetical protein
VIHHPSRDATLAIALMLCGGPGMFLLARAWYQRRVFATAARAQFLAIGLLGVIVATARSGHALVAAVAVVAVLAGLVVVEHLNPRQSPTPVGRGEALVPVDRRSAASHVGAATPAAASTTPRTRLTIAIDAVSETAAGSRIAARMTAFVVGGASLGTEIAAARLLVRYFGASTIIWANTIATILVALSIGYAVGGCLADRRAELRGLRAIVLTASLLLAFVAFVADRFLRLSVNALGALSVAGSSAGCWRCSSPCRSCCAPTLRRRSGAMRCRPPAKPRARPTSRRRRVGSESDEGGFTRSQLTHCCFGSEVVGCRDSRGGRLTGII